MTRRNVWKQGWVFPLFSRLCLNFHRFVILYISCDTRTVGLGQYCLLKVSTGFKGKDNILRAVFFTQIWYWCICQRITWAEIIVWPYISIVRGDVSGMTVTCYFLGFSPENLQELSVLQVNCSQKVRTLFFNQVNLFYLLVSLYVLINAKLNWSSLKWYHICNDYMLLNLAKWMTMRQGNCLIDLKYEK